MLVQYIDEVKKGYVDSFLSCLWLLIANLCGFITLSKPTSERFYRAVGITIDNTGYDLGPYVVAGGKPKLKLTVTLSIAWHNILVLRSIC